MAGARFVPYARNMSTASRAEVVLDLSAHCVETAARSEHRRLTGELLRGGGTDASVEARVELLHEFLEQTDFRALRAAQPVLAGGRPRRVALLRTPDGAAHWRLLEEPEGELR